MKQISSHFAACVGLDWAYRKHDFCLKMSESEALVYWIFEHSPESIEEWALTLQTKFNSRLAAICLELKARPLVYALLKYRFIVIFPIPPKALSKYREAFSPSGAKDHPTDSFLQLDYLLKHPESLNPLNPDKGERKLLLRVKKT